MMVNSRWIYAKVTGALAKNGENNNKYNRYAKSYNRGGISIPTGSTLNNIRHILGKYMGFVFE